MREVTSTVYQFSELSDSAKETARQWYRGCMDSSDYSESIIEDAMQVAAILGIEIATRPVKLMGGTTRQDPCIFWSGFCSQGDGACFEGWYSYKKGSTKAIRAYAPQDKTLHHIADHLASWQCVNFYRLQAKMKATYGNHMTVDVHDGEYEYRAVPEEGIRDLMRQFADWIYRQLEKEYEYQTSDSAVEESIEANEYEFTEEGERA
jgi:hypothetical protein